MCYLHVHYMLFAPVMLLVLMRAHLFIICLQTLTRGFLLVMFSGVTHLGDLVAGLLNGTGGPIGMMIETARDVDLGPGAVVTPDPGTDIDLLPGTGLSRLSLFLPSTFFVCHCLFVQNFCFSLYQSNQ